MKITTALFNKMYRIEIRAVAAICEVYLVFSVVCCQVYATYITHTIT